ncbi:hypothetical protein [Acidianus brierleyi]|uniref:Uncharacterized protein n=1 Tax=Acidianus brierleyi TaxID=41673 RepID=A0A2U9IHH5_9CREN|nr:hypothetical protein [Acidianus brierleyi]AWR95492.1 hypothetical protein DFR85_13700 [Acidianus brierleyi]
MNKKEGELIIQLFRNPLQSYRSIAKEIDVSNSLITYMLRRSYYSPITKDLVLSITPNFFNLYKSTIVFKEDPGNIPYSLKFKGDNNTFVMIYGKNSNNITEILKSQGLTTSNINMRYDPEQLKFNFLSFPKRLMELLIADPNQVLDYKKLGEKMNSPPATIRRYINYFIKNNIIQFFPKINIEKNNMYLFTLITQNFQLSMSLLRNYYTILRPLDNYGLIQGIIYDEEGTALLDKLKSLDKKVYISIQYKYETNQTPFIRFLKK